MPLPFQSGETVTVRRLRPLVINGVRQVDEYGALIMQAHDELVSGVAIWPQSSSEALQGEDRTRGAYLLALPPEIAVDGIDRIVWRGLEYEIDGEPEQFTSPFTGNGLQQLTIVRVEG